jgi:cation transport ATPase
MLIISGFFLLIGVVSLSWSLMYNSIVNSELGDIFDIIFSPLILCIIPLLFIKKAIKELYNYDLKTWLIVTISIIFTIFVAIWSFSQTYNYFIQADENIQYKYDNVMVFYDKKFDLIPKLEMSSRSFTNHEKEIISEIVDARKSYKWTTDSNKKID